MRRIRFNYVGLVFGCVGYFIALTPSLMPRPAIFIGIVAGVGFTIWYAIGILASRTIRKHKLISEPDSDTKRHAWLLLAGLSPIFVALTTLLARNWQNEQRALLDQPPIPSISPLTIACVAIVVFIILILIKRGLGWVYRRVRFWVAKIRFLPPYVGAAAAFVLATIIIVGTLTGVLERTAVVAINETYSSSNNFVDPKYPQPTSELRSGSEASEAKWQGLGREGRRFVASGPNAGEITQFNGESAKEPIRVYTGLNNASSRHAQVDLAMKELDRTGAFNRKMLMVVIPTGSGWIEAETVAAFEYMHGGDTAIVSAQYSYLPSALAFVLEQSNAIAMGKELLHAVENKLQSLPVDARPKLVAYGLSLGSYGGQADFTGESDFARRLDAGLFVGTPGFSEPWRAITSQRDAGTPQIKPTYHGSQVIKFANDSEDLINDTNPSYKIVYFQYATDPIVWFDARLLYAKPDWMREEPGRGVSPHLRWFPIVTFLQVAVDQIFSLSIPTENGHDYSRDTVAPLAAATKPTNWSADKSRSLQAIIAPPKTSQGSL